MIKARPQITVSRSGVRQVSPAQIITSRVGQEQIQKTARAAAARVQRGARTNGGR